MDTAIFEHLYAAEQLAQRLRSIAEALGPKMAAAQFYTRLRVKDASSVKQKVYRKRYHDRRAGYNFRDLTDIVGFRIVTLYDHDLKNAFDVLVSMIEMGRGSPQPLFLGDSLWDSLREANLYYRHITKDGLESVYEPFLKHIHQRIDSTFNLKRKDERKIAERHKSKVYYGPASDREYSSAHFIFDGYSYYKGTEHRIPIEVQIRTAAEDIWGEINHRLLYKADNKYIWSPEMQGALDELSADSGQFKVQIEGLSSFIQRFLDHSAQVEGIRKKFKEPTTRLHSSLVISLFYSISNEYLTDSSNLIDEYGRIIDEIKQNFEKPGCAAAIGRAKEVVSAIRSEVAATLDSVRHDVRTAHPGTELAKLPITPGQTICLQRLQLVEFEFHRLNILELLSDLEVRQLPPVGADFEKGASALLAIVDQLEILKTDPRAKVRPVSAMSFWQFFAMRKVHEGEALKHIRAAKEELEYDEALPRWSIYRVVVHRYLAMHLIRYVLSRFRIPHSHGAKQIPLPMDKINNASVLLDTEALLIEAFESGLQAYSYDKLNDARRGDLIFGHRDKGEFHDADIVFLIYIVYYQIIGHLITDRSPDLLNRFNRMLAEIRHLVKRGTGDGESELIANKISAVEEIRSSKEKHS